MEQIESFFGKISTHRYYTIMKSMLITLIRDFIINFIIKIVLKRIIVITPLLILL
jgi:hypothetical protein